MIVPRPGSGDCTRTEERVKHPDWPAFLAALVAEPDEDTHRLVAADFLEEHGDPARAAFIRIQVALAQLESSGLGHSAEAGTLRRKELEFLGPRSSSPRWAAEDCPELVRGTLTQAGSLALRGDDAGLTWRRGFVEWVKCPAVEWLQHGVAVRKRNPVRRVILSGSESITRDAWLAGLEALRGLPQIDLVYAWDGDESSNSRGLVLIEWLRERLPGTRINMNI
jgi:uncharacterized protein (TIGR02996 family)